MTKLRATSRPRPADASLSALRKDLESLRAEKHAAAMLFDRRGNQVAATGVTSALIAGVGGAVLKEWRKIEAAEKSPDKETPAMVVTARFNSARWDSRALRDRLHEVLVAFRRGHQPLPGLESSFQLNWYRLATPEEVDTARKWLETGRRVARKRSAPGSATSGERRLESLESTVELAQIVEELERIKQPLRIRLQRVLDGLADRTLDSPELNAQVVKQINALRTALGVALRFKESKEPIYLRCVVTSGARAATIQAVSADQKRTNLAASAGYPALEVFELGEDS